MIYEYDPPTIEEWHQLVLAIEALGWKAMLEGGGAANTFVAIELPDGRALAFGDNDEYWSADPYPSLAALQSGENPVGLVETELPVAVHDATRIAKALLAALTDVCIAGNPAILGCCGDPDCVCR